MYIFVFEKNTVHTIRNIGLVFIISLLVIATGGFSIYHHLCNCAGETTSSLFLKLSCEHETQVSCCSMEESHSCCMEKPSQESKQACHDEDCCQTSSQFLRISDSFQPGLDKISLKPFAATTMLVCFNIQADEIPAISSNYINSDLPPPKTGRQKLVALHQLKLDPFLV